MNNPVDKMFPQQWIVLTTPYLLANTRVKNDKGIHSFNFTFLVDYFLALLFLLPFKIKLRPLTSMQSDEALDLIKSAAPDVYGDYRYRKWVAVLDEKNKHGIWTAYKVTRPDKGDDRVFTIDLINGQIIYYDGEYKCDGALKSYYQGWYYEHGFDIPTYPTGKTLKELNLAYYE